MEILDAIRTRRSIRAFRPDPVPREVLAELLDVCRWSPSGRNAQPWHFAVLGGAALDEVKARLDEKVRTSWNGSEFTDRHPDLVRRVVLIGPAGMPLTIPVLARVVIWPGVGDYLMRV